MAMHWLERTWWQSLVLHPNMAVVILSIGCLFLLIEFHRPGRVVYGAFGTLLVLFAAWGLAQHPLNWIALAMLAAGALLLFLETRLYTHEIAAVVGITMFFAGLLFLVLPPAQPVRVPTALFAGLGVGGTAFRLATFARRARQQKYALNQPAG